MTTIYHEADADPSVLAGLDVAVVGYGNQGRSWALNLRDSGVAVRVAVRADASRAQAHADGFDATELEHVDDADVLCLLVPDDAIPALPIMPRPDALVVLASGYCPAFGRYQPVADVGLVAPRMLGPEVRRCYQEGVGFITGVGVHRDETGTATDRTLAVAHAIGGLRQGAIELSMRQEAVLDLAVEQVLSPALRRVSEAFVAVMLERDIPLEAVLTELFLSGEVERTYRLLRLEGYAAQMAHHSPTSQYGQLSRSGRFDHLDVPATMRTLVDDITSGRFADEWEADRDAGHPELHRLLASALPPELVTWEAQLRSQLGEQAGPHSGLMGPSSDDASPGAA
jgi:ketol-acid reductoisomerase